MASPATLQPLGWGQSYSRAPSRPVAVSPAHLTLLTFIFTHRKRFSSQQKYFLFDGFFFKWVERICLNGVCFPLFLCLSSELSNSGEKRIPSKNRKGWRVGRAVNRVGTSPACTLCRSAGGKGRRHIVRKDRSGTLGREGKKKDMSSIQLIQKRGLTKSV